MLYGFGGRNGNSFSFSFVLVLLKWFWLVVRTEKEEATEHRGGGVLQAACNMFMFIMQSKSTLATLIRSSCSVSISIVST